MEIKVLGTGCPKCKKLEAIAQEAVKEAGLEANITKVEDMNDIMQYGVMVTPALVVDEKVVVSGKVPKKEELITLISNK